MVGLREIDDGLWLVLAGSLAVGLLDARKRVLQPFDPYFEVR
jgi:hypothetical protein